MQSRDPRDPQPPEHQQLSTHTEPVDIDEILELEKALYEEAMDLDQLERLAEDYLSPKDPSESEPFPTFRQLPADIQEDLKEDGCICNDRRVARGKKPLSHAELGRNRQLVHLWERGTRVQPGRLGEIERKRLQLFKLRYARKMRLAPPWTEALHEQKVLAVKRARAVVALGLGLLPDGDEMKCWDTRSCYDVPYEQSIPI